MNSSVFTEERNYAHFLVFCWLLFYKQIWRSSQVKGYLRTKLNWNEWCPGEAEDNLSLLYTPQTPRNTLIILYANITRYQIACQFVSRLLPNEQLICPLESHAVGITASFRYDFHFWPATPQTHRSGFPTQLLLSHWDFGTMSKTKPKRGLGRHPNGKTASTVE